METNNKGNNMKSVSVSCAVVYDVKEKEYKAIGWLKECDFKNGVFKSEYGYYILIEFTNIHVDLPEGFDPIKPQLDELDHREKEVTFKYNQTIRQINVERQNLLAIEAPSNY